ncbi:hypothetical protein DL768_005998 [Monosporascus sp. mg162]|nr:hypothetical protein DL768_005998 [Monosporascus sp. mg162]
MAQHQLSFGNGNGFCETAGLDGCCWRDEGKATNVVSVYEPTFAGRVSGPVSWGDPGLPRTTRNLFSYTVFRYQEAEKKTGQL